MTTQTPARVIPDIKNVLYIEDNEHNISMMKEMMALVPFVTLHVARTGIAGLRAVRSLDPDLVLLDVHLPDIPGYKVLERIRELSKKLHVPVVAFTSGDSQNELCRIDEANFDHVMIKPVCIANLQALVRDHFERRVVSVHQESL